MSAFSEAELAYLASGRAEAIREPRPMIRIHADRIVSFGLNGQVG